ncbi:CoA-dependent acyltransferase, partial [Aspergillus campestris IBT 28561]
MLESNSHREELLKSAVGDVQATASEIEDIYPCTPVQESLMALSIQKPGTYVARYVYRIPVGVDLARFCNAWEMTVRAHPIFRTRIIERAPLGMFQIVLKSGIKLETAQSVRAYLASDMEKSMQFGTQLIRAGISGFSQEASNAWFVITIHHALYDDWGLRVVLNDLERAYLGSNLQIRPFKSFVQYCLRARAPESENFWRLELANMNATIPWTVPSARYIPSATMLLERAIKHKSGDDQNLTSAMVKAGWSLVLSQYTDATEVLFGVTSTGRQGHIPGLDVMSGVSIATTPLRTHVSPDMTVKDLVGKVFDQELRLLPHEHFGLSAISHLSADTAAACKFTCLLVMQPHAIIKSSILHEVTEEQDLQNHSTFGTYPLTLVCNQAADFIKVQAVYDQHIIPSTQMNLILDQFAHIMSEVTATS